MQYRVLDTFAADTVGSGLNIDALLRRSVLVIADDPLQALVLTDRLRAADYTVTAANSDAEACDLATHQSFPVIVVDYKLGNSHDAGLLEHLRRRLGDRSYLIARSVLGTQEERDQSLAHGADDHVSKLLSAAEFLSRIEAGFEAMANRGSRRLMRLVRSCGAAFGRNLDTEEWNISAVRLHSEIRHALRDRKPLSVFVVHVERQIVPRERPLLTCAQFIHFASALDSILKINTDFALPLDARDGLVRILVVLRDTTLHDAEAIRRRLCSTLIESTDESSDHSGDESGIFPDCSIGLATVESWETATITNASEFVALAERSMEKLAILA